MNWRDFFRGFSSLTIFPPQERTPHFELPRLKTADEVIAKIRKTRPETLWTNPDGPACHWHPAASLWTWPSAPTSSPCASAKAAPSARLPAEP